MDITTTIKAEANRRNAQLSTGPVTEHGKAIVAQNARKHGLLSLKLVLPGEDAEMWDEHLGDTFASLTPRGHLETLLAERVALFLWRLGRVALYEAEIVAMGVETAEIGWTRFRAGEQHIANPPRRTSAMAAVNAKFETAKAETELGAQLRDLPATESIDPTVAASIVEQASKLANVDLDRGGMSLPDIPDGTDLTQVPWTAARLVKVIDAIAAFRPGSEGDLLTAVTSLARERFQSAEHEKNELEQELARYRRRLIIPDPVTMERVGRYESHLERGLYKALHELQRLQAARQRQHITPPVAVDVMITGANQE